ncbi:hypothetical protein NMG60_11022032 [Bertholletia excelsa]
MGKAPIPFLPPPPPPATSSKSEMSMMYYGLVVVAIAAIVLAVYNLIIIRWCADIRRFHHRGSGRPLEPVSSRSFDNSNIQLVASFKYKKGEGVAQDQGCDYECPVCLSVFEEGEEVRQLPRCNHSFHASCIDMWLYSHFDCPVCRAPVEPPVLQRRVEVDQPEHSREGLLPPAISV